MKTLRQLEDRILTAVMVVALMVPLVLVAVSQANMPSLYFEANRIQVAQDGSVQLLVDVSVSHVEMAQGVRFDLRFNGTYITPSDFVTNQALVAGDEVERAFRVSPTLYQVDPDGDGVYEFKDPFQVPTGFGGDKNGLTLNRAGGTLTLSLFANSLIDPKAENGVGMNTLLVNEDEGEKRFNVFDAREKLKLCTLSFRVADPDAERMAEITRLFHGLTNVLFDANHAIGDTKTTLVSFQRVATTSSNYNWHIGCFVPFEGDYKYIRLTEYPEANTQETAQALFTYNFPRTIIKARAAEAELTINAYQAYTNNTVGDIDQALQRYSPAITVTYSDGSEGNFIMPWGRMGDTVDGLDWMETVVYDWADEDWTGTDWKDSLSSKKQVKDRLAITDPDTQIDYDPTASRYKDTPVKNQHYLVQKDFCYQEWGENKVFPLPIDVKLTVTPITLLDVTANDLRRSYVLNDALVSGPTAVQTAGALKLPSQARLITDVPAGGATLTMDIPGWSHEQVNGYWPSDKDAGGTGDAMGDLWRDGVADGTYLHWPTISDVGRLDPPTMDGNGAYVGTNRAGDYTFTMAESYGGNPKYFTRYEIQQAYPWLTVPDGTKIPTDIEAWPIDDALRTVVWNGEPTSPDDPPKKKLVDTTQYQVSYVSTVEGANNQPEVTFEVRKMDERANLLSLPEESVFRIKLPDGTEMAVGLKDDEIDQGGDWYNDNDGSYTSNSFMLTEDGAVTDKRGFYLTSNPGAPETGSYGDEREKLRRYINLGGWFSVSVKEREPGDDGAVTETTFWSDFMPVYVPPRDNYYTENKEYNFIGDNAGLYPWAGGLSTTVILPPGTYNPVAINATAIERVYESDGTRKVERYDLTTTYDGATGAQPGRLNTFTIDPVPSPAPNNYWQTTASTVGTHNITTYGKEVFLDGAIYSAYGKVLNKLNNRSVMDSGYATDAKTVTIRLEETAPAHPVEKIILEFVETHGGEKSVDYDDTYGYDPEYRERYNVTNVIFETRTQGYTARQDYVLRIKNVGDVDIHGLSIDTLTDLVGNPVYDKDLDSAPAGGHFEILRAPASFLPVGESTTFVLTYVYNLQAYSDRPVNYRDKLFITSNSKHTVGTNAYNAYHDDMTADADRTYLLDFDAQFQVTNSDIYRVTVRYIPADGCMGTANVVIGLTDVNDLNSMNLSAGPTAYAAGDQVYILISPTDEYTMVNVSAANTAIPSVIIDTAIGLGPYDIASKPGSTGNLPGNDVRMVYSFTMPAHDTTITVVFNEPVRSKLRISDLRVYRDLDHDADADPTDEDFCLYPSNENWHDVKDTSTGEKYKDAYEELPIWQKSFTNQEQTDAAAYTQGDNKNLYLMTKGAASKPGSRPNFDDTVEQYLVVLPFDADWAQVEVDLRKVQYIFNTANGDPITNLPLTGINVQMTLYDSADLLLQQSPSEVIFSKDSNVYPDTWNGQNYAISGQTNDPTTHTSIPFLSPTPGTSKYVRVELSYTDATQTESRAYYIELHRAPKEVSAELHYGNSPYGMIMNDKTMTAIRKRNAKTAFVSNNFTFNGMDSSLIPAAVAEGGLTSRRYWLEAWAEPTEKWTAPNADWSTTNNYDPDPLASPDPNGVYDADTGMSWTLYHQVTTDNTVNLDLNDYAFFAIMGESFKDPGLISATDSSGRPVDLSKAILSLSVYTLDNSTGVDKDSPDGQLTRFALPAASAIGVPSAQDPDDVKARTVTIDFVDTTDGTPAASGDTVQNDWATWYRNADGDLTQTAEGNTKVELRPGRYRLVYTFPDYNYVPDNTDYDNNFLTVYRDFVVLAPVGDVNADLTVKAGTNSDESLMEGRISPDAGYPALGYMADNYDYSAIFKLRTCDVNNDRNINNIDANAILRESGVERFYLPVDYIK